MTTLEDVFIDPAGYAQLESRYRGAARDAPDFHAVALRVEARACCAARSTPTCAASRRCSRVAGAAGEVAGEADRGVRGRDRRAGGGAAGVPHVHRRRASGGATSATARCSSARSPRRASAAAPTRRRSTRSSARCSASGATRRRSWRARGSRSCCGCSSSPAPRRRRGSRTPRSTSTRRSRRATKSAAIRACRWTARWSACTRCSPSAPSGTPRALNATNTHDTKRSADVRARLDALSEHAASWERRLRLWRRRHRALRRLVRGRLAPTRTTDYFIYQALRRHLADRRAARCDDDAAAAGRRCASGSRVHREGRARGEGRARAGPTPTPSTRGRSEAFIAGAARPRRRPRASCATSRRSSPTVGAAGHVERAGAARRAPHRARRAGHLSAATSCGSRRWWIPTTGGRWTGTRATRGSTRSGARCDAERTVSRRSTCCADGARTWRTARSSST